MELLEYLQAEFDCKEIEEFKTHIDEKSNYNVDAILSKFALTKAYFTELDRILVDIAYTGNQSDINKVRDFLREKISTVGILQFNKFLKKQHVQQIDNHIKWLQMNKKKINWRRLSENPVAIELISTNLDKVYWTGLSENPAAIKILENNLDKVRWVYLSSNPAAIQLIEQNVEKVDWHELSENPAAIKILEKSLDKVRWYRLSWNLAAIPILENNLDKVRWYRLSSNSAAIPILENNLDKVD